MGGKFVTGSDNSSNNNENEKTEKIDVHIGVFFDGTGNSMMNIRERNEYLSRSISDKKRSKYYKKNDSHTNGFSNVANIYTIYKNDNKKIFSVYVEGIGTAPRPIVDPKEYKDDYFKGKGSYSDSTLGQAIGFGAYGVNAKIERACKKITAILQKLKEEATTPVEFELTMDVFGFSRGAAAARSFTSRIKSPKGDTTNLKKAFAAAMIASSYNTVLTPVITQETNYKVCLMDNFKPLDIKISGNIKVDFLGLFDTVSSYGLKFDDDVKELALTIDTTVVSKVYQICAADEYRKNFSLTLINDDKRSKIIPGAHSDIGGGYSDNMEEQFIMYNNIHNAIYTSPSSVYMPLMTYQTPMVEHIYAGNKKREELIRDGWFNDDDIARGSRFVRNSYCHIPLNIMLEELGSDNLENKSEFDISKEEEPIKKFYDVAKGKDLYNFVKENGKTRIKRNSTPVDEALMKTIRHEYLHLSVKGEPLHKVFTSPGLLMDKRFVNAACPNNIRIIIENA